MHDPLVTILMPAYNAAAYIGEAIESVLQQSFTDFELLVVDDGSTDDTSEQVLQFRDPRIVRVQTTHGGVAKALNAGLQKAKGKYIARMDADDSCMPNRIEKQLQFLESHPDHIIVGSDAQYMLETGEFLFDFHCAAYTDETIRPGLQQVCPFIHSSVMYRKEAVLLAGAYPEHAHNFEDHLLWIRLSRQGKMANLPEPLMRIRFNTASVTVDEKWRGKYFRRLKKEILQKETIRYEEGEILHSIIAAQNLHSFKQGAYYALCAKKFLNNNYQPARARHFAKQAIQTRPLRFENYLLYLASYLPQNIIHSIHAFQNGRR